MDVMVGSTEGMLEPEGLWRASDLRQVVARLVDGDTVVIGTAPDRRSALVLARTVIAELESPTGGWPLVGDRLLRPEAIVSIDVLRQR